MPDCFFSPREVGTYFVKSFINQQIARERKLVSLQHWKANFIFILLLYIGYSLKWAIKNITFEFVEIRSILYGLFLKLSVLTDF